MKKILLITLGIIMLLAVSISIGYYLYVVQYAKESERELAELNNIESNVNNQIEDKTILQANTEEEKVTPNTQFILQKHYVQCGHTTIDYVEIPSEIVNMTQEQIQEKYKEWEIEKFSKEDVILKKEESGNCDQHYVLRENNGYVAIYWVNQNGMESLKEITGIAIEYLPEEDIAKFKEGIFVYGLQELNTIIEDYE